MRLLVGRIGRAHGILGEATIEVRTDEPDRRFAIGSKVQTDAHGELTILLAVSITAFCCSDLTASLIAMALKSFAIL